MSTLLKKLMLAAILVIASVLRLWNLGGIPPGLTPDEAGLGYNAYSILITARDEHGTFLPLIFKSFGDFKPGFYVYTLIPFIWTIGLSELSVRLPSAVSGIFSVYLIYLIVRIFIQEGITSNKITNVNSEALAFAAALVAAINPYLIYFSRGAWEANLSLMLTLAGILFFIKSLKKEIWLVASSLCFALTILTYQGAKLSSVLVLVVLVLLYWKQFARIQNRIKIAALLAGVVICFPVILSIFDGRAARLGIFSIFSYTRPEFELEKYNDGFFSIFHSNQLNYLRMILTRWFNFFSGQFLFLAGDLEHPIHTPPYAGVLLLADLIWLPIGLFSLIKNRFGRFYLFVLCWLLLSPLPAAISRDQTNAVRSLNAAIPLVITSGIGLGTFLSKMDAGRRSIIKLIFVSIIIIVSFVYFVDAYFVHYPIHNSGYSGYKYKILVNKLSAIQNKYESIYIEQSFEQPYIYFLFYQKIRPEVWFKQSRIIGSGYVGDVGFQEKLGNISFVKPDWSRLKYSKGSVVVASPSRVPKDFYENVKILDNIVELDNKNISFTLMEVR